MRHADGSGFAYYPNGRKALCITSFGKDLKGLARRFSAVIYSDLPKSPILGLFDEWGRGEAPQPKTDPNGGLLKVHPRWLIMDDLMTISDKDGNETLLDLRKPDREERVLKLSNNFTIRRTAGRTTIEFSCERVRQNFPVGEVQGELPQGLSKSQPLPKGKLDNMKGPGGDAGPGAKTLGDTMEMLKGMHAGLDTTMKVDPWQPRTKTEKAGEKTMEEVLAELTQLAANPLAFTTETTLKIKLMEKNPWMNRGKTICKWSGKYTDEGASMLPSIITCPRSLKEVSQLALQDEIDSLSGKSTLLVVVCLASYAAQSAYARGLAERTWAEFVDRHIKKSGGDPRDPQSLEGIPVRICAVEMAECNIVRSKYGVRDVPYCLMFQGGTKVYGQKMGGSKEVLRYPDLSRPRLLLLEPQACNQLRSERAVRRNGLNFDLATSSAEAIRRAAQDTYGILLASTEVGVEELRNVYAAVRRNREDALLFLVHDATAPPVEGEDEYAKKALKEEHAHLFMRPLGKVALETTLTRFKTCKPQFKAAGTTKDDFVKEIERVMEGRGPS